MIEQLEAIKARFDQVGVALTNPEIINNHKEFEKFSREYRQLDQPFVEARLESGGARLGNEEPGFHVQDSRIRL